MTYNWDENLVLEYIRAKTNESEVDLIYKQQNNTECLYKIRTKNQIITIIEDSDHAFTIIDIENKYSGITPIVGMVCSVFIIGVFILLQISSII